MPQIVTQARDLYAQFVRRRNIDPWLTLSEIVDKYTSQVRHTDAVCKSPMGCARKDVVRGAYLQQVSKTLELRCVHQNNTNGVDGNMPMDRVVKYFFLGRLLEQMFVVFGSFLWSAIFI